MAGGVGGPGKATKVALAGPCGVSFGADRIYVADTSAVRAVNRFTDQLTTLVGTGANGPLANGGSATGASVRTCGVAVDHTGNLVIANGGLPGRDRIVVAADSTGPFYGRAMKAGHIYIVAGNGTAGFAGDGGPATSAELYDPANVAVDAAGNLAIADTSNNRVRVVAETTGTYYGQAMTAGDIYTVAGGGDDTGDGEPATSAALSSPDGVAVDAAGNLIIADDIDAQIRVVAVQSGTFYGQAMTAGDIYTIAGDGAVGFSGDGGPATSAELEDPRAVTLDSAGNVLIADRGNNRVRVVAETSGTFYGQAMTAGDIYTVAGGGRGLGNGGLAMDASVPEPSGVTVDGAGNLVIASPYKFYRVRVVAEHTGTFYGQAMTAGHIYTVAGNGPGLFSGNRGRAGHAQFQPTAVTSDAAGDLLISAANDQRVLMTAPRGGTFYGQAMTAGRIYTIAGSGTCKFTGDSGPATKAGLCEPEGTSVDTAGNLLIADTSDQRIRVVAASTGTFYGQAMTAGNIYTVAGDGSTGFSGDGGPATSAELSAPTGVAVDAARNVLIADSNNQRIRVVAATTGTFYGQAMTAGNIYTVAGDGSTGFSGDGGPATSAALNIPSDVTVDAAGNILIADSHNQRIRVVAATTGTFYGQAMAIGQIYTIAGDGKQRFSGDGAPATGAGLSLPSGVTVDAAGNVVIADSGHNRIRVVAEASGTFYGETMTAGNIYTVAGNGRGGSIGGFSGDGGPGTKAELGAPGGVAVNGAGNLLIPDFYNGRIRMVTG